MILHRSLLLLLALSPVAVACTQQKPEPDIASASSLAGYAETYPAELTAVTKQVSESEAEVKKTSDELSQFPGQLKNPPWPVAVEVVDRADEAGRSWAFVERMRQVQLTQSFLSQEKDEITRKIAGAVQYAAKQKNCDPEVANSVPHAFKEAVDKRLEENLRASNEAFLVIDRHRDEIPKDDAATLEKHADAIAYASYLAHVELVEHKVKLQRMVSEADRIKKTADEYIEEESRRSVRANATAADKKAAADRIDRMKKSRASVDAALEQTKSVLDNVDERVKLAQDGYTQALTGLRGALEQKVAATAAK